MLFDLINGLINEQEALVSRNLPAALEIQGLVRTFKQHLPSIVLYKNSSVLLPLN